MLFCPAMTSSFQCGGRDRDRATFVLRRFSSRRSAVAEDDNTVDCIWMAGSTARRVRSAVALPADVGAMVLLRVTAASLARSKMLARQGALRLPLSPAEAAHARIQAKAAALRLPGRPVHAVDAMRRGANCLLEARS